MIVASATDPTVADTNMSGTAIATGFAAEWRSMPATLSSSPVSTLGPPIRESRLDAR